MAKRFEALLTDANILFHKMNDQYIMNPEDWDDRLLAALKSQGFTTDTLGFPTLPKDPVLKETLEKIKTQLNPDEPMAIIHTHLPPKLQRAFDAAFKTHFGTQPLATKKGTLYLPIASKTIFENMLASIEQPLHGEYFHSENPEFQQIITQLGYRLKISIDPAKHNKELDEFFIADDADPTQKNTKATEEDGIYYYIDMSTLAHKKDQFIDLVVKYGLTIEYFDVDKNNYLPIDQAPQHATLRADGETTSEDSDSFRPPSV